MHHVGPEKKPLPKQFSFIYVDVCLVKFYGFMTVGLSYLVSLTDRGHIATRRLSPAASQSLVFGPDFYNGSSDEEILA